jgi:Tol biopolymer transport system component
MNTRRMLWLAAVACCGFFIWDTPRPARGQSAAGIGLFEGQSGVGKVLHAGSVEFDAAKQTYTISGSGENMWAAADGFHFVWKRVSGDVTLAADISILGQGGNAHRKGVLMVRQSLDGDSAYADAALHGDGLTSLQARDEKGGNTREVQSNMSAPKRLRIEKRGDYLTMSVAGAGEDLHLSGGSMRVPLQDPFYVGLAVCAHDANAVEKALFSNVELVTTPARAAGKTALYSTIETVPVASGDRRAAYVAAGRLEAPTWTRDGESLIFSADGRLQRVPAAGGKPQVIDTGFATRINRHHGVSPDGALVAISDESREQNRSVVYVVPITGGAPRRVTQQAPAWFQGWSPDGKTILVTAERNGKTDIYTVPVEGGQETRITTAAGRNDNPEFSPDGKFVYFNSDRTGTMQIWRMQAEGSGQEQLTSDEYGNWSPHVSPDGRRIVFLSYEKGVSGQPEDRDVMLRLLTLSNKATSVFAKLIGGPGTLDAACWSPDGRRLTFVSFQLLPAR